MPATFIDGQLALRVQIQGRGLDVILDTGAPVNVLDRSIFDNLHLVANDQKQGHAVEVDAGSLKMFDVYFYPLTFYRRLDPSTTVVGTLGYDFFRNAVVKVDYDASTIEVIAPDSFGPPNGAIEIPIRPGARVPYVSANLGKASGDSFVLDTGASTDVVFPEFADLYPDMFSPDKALHDTDQYRYLRQYFPVCGLAEHEPYSVPSLRVGAVGVRDWIVWKPIRKSCFNLTGVDGLIGYDFLRLFTVYIDYANWRVILLPNQLYRTASNTLKP